MGFPLVQESKVVPPGHQNNGLFDGWHLGPFYCPPDDVIVIIIIIYYLLLLLLLQYYYHYLVLIYILKTT